MRYVLWVLVLLMLSVTLAAAQEPPPEKENLPSLFPLVERNCKITQQDWQVGVKTKTVIDKDGKKTFSEAVARHQSISGLAAACGEACAQTLLARWLQTKTFDALRREK